MGIVINVDIGAVFQLEIMTLAVQDWGEGVDGEETIVFSLEVSDPDTRELLTIILFKIHFAIPSPTVWR